MCHPYIESATALSDIIMITFFCRAAKMNFMLLAGPRNVSVDLNYEVLCLCMVYPFESGEVTA